jgi:hypothetical protein
LEFVKYTSIYLESYSLNSVIHNSYLNSLGKIPDILDKDCKIPKIYEITMEAGKGELYMSWGAVVINLSIRAAYPHVWPVLKPKSHRKAI